MRFFIRDFQQRGKRRKKKLRKRRTKNKLLEQDMLNGMDDYDDSRQNTEAPPPRKGKGKTGRSSRERSMSKARISSGRQRSCSSTLIAPREGEDKSRRLRGRSRSRVLDRGRSRGKMRVTNSTLENDDNRRQLV